MFWPLDGLVEKALDAVLPGNLGTLTFGFVTPAKIAEAIGGMTGGVVGPAGKANEDKALGDINNIFGGISKAMPKSMKELAEKTGVVKKKVGEMSALEVADEYVGKINVLVENVMKCCKHHPNLPGSLKCATILTGFQQIAMGFHEAVSAFFKDFAMPENWKDGVCKLLSMETAVKPIQDTATSVMKLFEKLDNTCIMPSPGQATELMKSMAGVGGVPKEIIDGKAMAKADLKKKSAKSSGGDASCEAEVRNPLRDPAPPLLTM
eukprot:CAMPEP_0179221986 /NCGR_PEP_ID=MMETSP0797-20121207/6481_1 /TAXON_ID=47934 /ORGANISM="Dinophysis acuminata, Strain DAEP01" /LENGTH=263 /DNA_ID=CAMNT_0020928801 /DNA_START=125 /DNA_END=917 /DNA_ORIENTATION=-